MAGIPMKIVFLADVPEHLSTVSKWIFEEWGHLNPSSSLEKVETRFRTHLNRSAIPLTLLAVNDLEPVGTASLVAYDISYRQDLTPWLSGVYVKQNARQMGIGTALVQAVENIAQQFLVKRLYLFTPDRESFYARLDWKTFQHSEYRGQAIVIMEKRLAPAPKQV